MGGRRMSDGRALYHRWVGSSTSDAALYFDLMNPAHKADWDRLAREINEEIAAASRLSPFLPRAADRLYAECDRAIRAGRIDARSGIGDAALDYRDMRWPDGALIPPDDGVAPRIPSEDDQPAPHARRQS